MAAQQGRKGCPLFAGGLEARRLVLQPQAVLPQRLLLVVHLLPAAQLVAATEKASDVRMGELVCATVFTRKVLWWSGVMGGTRV